MNDFMVYPAIDLRQGKVVRLAQGDPDRQTNYGDDPLEVARKWGAQGATWLHVVNLDGAFGEGDARNSQAILAVNEALGSGERAVCLQLGGGLRSMPAIEAALAAGVARVVLGTVAVENIDLVREALQQFGGDRIAVGIDVRDGFVRSRGWTVDSGQTPLELAKKLVPLGLKTIIVTNIACDGVQTGPDVSLSCELAAGTGLDVIASGGVATLGHIDALREAGLAGVVVGRALYEG